MPYSKRIAVTSRWWYKLQVSTWWDTKPLSPRSRQSRHMAHVSRGQARVLSFSVLHDSDRAAMAGAISRPSPL